MTSEHPGRLPKAVNALLLDTGAWLVGSAVPWLTQNAPKPKDIDILVPPHQWGEVLRRLTDKDFRLNTFGGVRTEFEGFPVDLWPGTLNDYYARATLKKPLWAMRLDPYTVLLDLASEEDA